MRKVLIISYYWPPSGGPGVQRWLKLSKYLAKEVKVFVVTVDPKQATYPLIDNSLLEDVHQDITTLKTHSFEPLGIFGKLFGQKKIPYSGFGNVKKDSWFSKITRFIRGNLFVPDARRGWNRYAISAAKKCILDNHIKTIITTGPPHSTHLIGLKLSAQLSIKWITDFRDPWTDLYYQDMFYQLKPTKRWNHNLERKVLENADLVVANCNSNKNLLESKVTVDEHKFVVLTNGFDQNDFGADGIDHNTGTDFTITYIGTMHDNYQPETFFEAIRNLMNDNRKIRLLFVGNISEGIKKRINQFGLDKITDVLGYLDHSKAIEYMQSADLLLYAFPNTKEDRGVAGKLFEYLASRRPIVGLGPTKGDSADIINECNAGEIFERGNSSLIEENILKWMQIKLEKGSTQLMGKAYLKYSRSHQASKVQEWID